MVRLMQNLGSGTIKQRVTRDGEGRSGGYRTIIAYWAGEKAFFVYGFAKNEQDNIDAHDLRLFKKAAAAYLSLTAVELQKLMDEGKMQEVANNDQDISN